MLLNSCTLTLARSPYLAILTSVINIAQFYAPDFGTANLELLARFFDKHPGYADKVFLSVKGGTKPNSITPDATFVHLLRL